MMRIRHSVLLVLAMAAVAHAQGFGWRGDGSGSFPAADPPRQWNIDSGTGILWQTEVGQGHSSPIVAGGHVFVTAEPNLLVCLDRQSGRIVWKRSNGLEILPAATPPPQRRAAAHRDCGYSTPTPVTDGKHVFACYGTGIVACYDLEGTRRWARLFDQEQLSGYGRTTSPVLVADRLVVSITSLLALSPGTGEVLWETSEAKPTYGTPAAAKVGAMEMLITPKGDCVRLSDGKILARKLGRMEYCSPLVQNGIVFFVGSPTKAVRLPETPGDSFQPQTLWENDDVEGEFYASPVCHEGILYCVSNEGVLYALEASTGKLIYQQELDLPAAGGKPGQQPANLYGSLTLAGKHLVVANDAGESLVLATGRQFRQAAHNYLDQGSGASPVADGKQLFLRGGGKLYCLGRP